MSGTARKQAPRLARPAAIYRPGKAPKGAGAPVDSGSEEEEDAQEVEQDGDVLIGGDQDIVQEDEDEDMPMRKTPAAKIKSMNVALKDVNISREGKVIVAGKEESGRTAVEEEEESEEESEEEDKEGAGDEETESSEEESESEEEEKPKLQFRPVFVSKKNRTTWAERGLLDDNEEAQKLREAEAEERKKQSHDMVAESIRRELAEKEKEEEVPDVDDSDGLDPEGEFEAWRLRELARIKRDKEEEVRREQEREEVERRRALPEAQRMQEDLEHAQKSRDAKPKGSQKFLQKYWHKGAFHQDEEILKRHDFTEATESTVDVSMLPQVMQVRNFGKRSRTKYTHLVDQDTTLASGGFGGAGTIKVGNKNIEGGQGCFLCGGPHMKKDCPQNTGPMMRGDRDGPKSWQDRGEDRGWPRDRRDKDREHSPRRDRSPRRERYHSRSRERDYRRRSRSRSRSRSPPRRRDYDRKNKDDRRHSRDWSPERGDYKGKRRKVDDRD